MTANYWVISSYNHLEIPRISAFDNYKAANEWKQEALRIYDKVLLIRKVQVLKRVCEKTVLNYTNYLTI